MNDLDTSLQAAEARDANDPLAELREAFSIPPKKDGFDCVYLCGNSLGLHSPLAQQYVEEEMDDWAMLGVEGHMHGRRRWLAYHSHARDGLAALTGSLPGEVVAMNTLTVNLHLMMTTFYRPEGKRSKIVIESTAFPSDRFACVSQLQLHGKDPATHLLEWSPREEDGPLILEDLEQLLDSQGEEIALLLLPGIQYYNGQLLPMAELCELARRHGCRIGLDLAHAIGNVELRLHDWAPDFAAWCSYKYLNAGPGAIGGAFVHEQHLDTSDSKQLLGWWGNAEQTRFKMGTDFEPADGADRWQLSNTPVFSMAPLLASLDMFERARFEALCDKSRELTGYLQALLESELSGRIGSITPETARGCQLSLVVLEDSVDGRAVFEALSAQNVIADWREPNVIRAAPVPIYNSYTDVWHFVQRLKAAFGE